MPEAYFSAEDNDGNIQLLEFLGIDESKALEEFHKLYDADQEIDQATEMGYVDPKSHVVHVDDVRRYVLLNVFMPMELYIYIDGGVLDSVYTDLPLKVIKLDTDDQADEPAIVRLEKLLPTKDLKKSLESYLDWNGTVARNDQFMIASTFHDYTIYLLDPEGNDIASHGMGDGVDDCEWNAGTFGHQEYLQDLIDTQQTMLMEAYFPEHIHDQSEA